MIICLENDLLYADKDIQKAILENCNGIIYAGQREGSYFYGNNSATLINSFSLNEDYFDEPISTPTKDNTMYKFILESYPATLMGEPDLDTIGTLAGLGCENITFTAYHNYVKWFGLRIPFFWTNQIAIWNLLEEKYGEFNSTHISWNKLSYKVTTPYKFNYCFIKLGQNSAPLIRWCKEHKKEIIIYVNGKTNKEKFLKLFKKFNKKES